MLSRRTVLLGLSGLAAVPFLAAPFVTDRNAVAQTGGVPTGPVNRPAAPAPDLAPLLQPREGELVLGNADAGVTVVAFVSLLCPHCQRWEAEQLPELRRLALDTGKARLILRDFPLDQPSFLGAAALRCIPDARRMEVRHAMAADVRGWFTRAEAAPAGDESRRAFECAVDRAVQQAVMEVRETGLAAGIRGTPTFFVGQRSITGGRTAVELVAMIDDEIAGRR